MRLAPVCAVVLLLAAPAAAPAAGVSVEGDALRVTAGPGELNVVTVGPAPAPGYVAVADGATPLAPGAGCVPSGTFVLCAGVARVEADLGDGNDELAVGVPLPVRASGGDGDDLLTGGDGPDRLDAGTGADVADGRAGDDVIVLRDLRTDEAWCGTGRDAVTAEALDELDFACERVDYGPPGRVGRLRPVIGGGRFVPIPGQGGALIDRRILSNVLYLVRRYHVRVGDGYATFGHEPRGEHPLGLAVDLYPGPGGSWRQVGRLAKWAEPRQNKPRPPFRWVGWNGDRNHGDPRHCRPARGCPPHLHLSWAHSPGRPRHPVRTVWTWVVRPGSVAP